MLWYTCYDPDTDEVLAIGPPQSCAGILGISVSTFYNYISNAKSGLYCPYTLVIEDTETGKMTTLHGSTLDFPLDRCVRCSVPLNKPHRPLRPRAGS